MAQTSENSLLAVEKLLLQVTKWLCVSFKIYGYHQACKGVPDILLNAVLLNKWTFHQMLFHLIAYAVSSNIALLNFGALQYFWSFYYCFWNSFEAALESRETELLPRSIFFTWMLVTKSQKEATIPKLERMLILFWQGKPFFSITHFFPTWSSYCFTHERHFLEREMAILCCTFLILCLSVYLYFHSILGE